MIMCSSAYFIKFTIFTIRFLESIILLSFFSYLFNMYDGNDACLLFKHSDYWLLPDLPTFCKFIINKIGLYFLTIY